MYDVRARFVGSLGWRVVYQGRSNEEASAVFGVLADHPCISGVEMGCDGVRLAFASDLVVASASGSVN